jgi:hypothetical protein
MSFTKNGTANFSVVTGAQRYVWLRRICIVFEIWLYTGGQEQVSNARI